MQSFFSPDSKIMQFVGRFTDLVILNFVFFLTCLPVFTIGAANAALYTVVFRMDTEREGGLFRPYFQAFRENFKQGTTIWLLFLLFAAATYLNMVYFSDIGGMLGYILFLVAMLVLLVLLMVFNYAFPLMSQFRNTIPGTCKNALILSIAYLPRSVILLVTNWFPWVLMVLNLYTFLKLGFLWTFLYFSAAAYFNTRVLSKVFQPFWEQAA